MNFSLQTHHLSFVWPDGTHVVTDLTTNLGVGLHAVVGPNGSGKTTLLQLLRGNLPPTQGHVELHGSIGYLPQRPTFDKDSLVADLLQIGEQVRALDAIAAGSVDPRHFEAIDNDWDIEARATAQLGAAGLDQISLRQSADSVSGGERTLLLLTGLLMKSPSVLLMDEPTNHLDSVGRSRVLALLENFPGCALVVTHDLELLSQVDNIGELRNSTIHWYGGNYADFVEAVEVEQAAARRALVNAQSTVRQQREQVQSGQTVIARRRRTGAKAAVEKRVPKILGNTLRSKAEESAGRLQAVLAERLQAAESDALQAAERVNSDQEIRVNLPNSRVPARRQVLTVTELRTAAQPHHRVSLQLVGPERIAIVGPNGSGKTTLLRTILGLTPSCGGEFNCHVPVGYLAQNLNSLPQDQSVLQTIQARTDATAHEIRRLLAQFLLRGDAVDRPVGSLSGGELWRATLASVLLAKPTPQLLILDEPTNHLDLASRQQLLDALSDFAGALLVVSHDRQFVDELAVNSLFDIQTSSLTPVADR